MHFTASNLAIKICEEDEWIDTSANYICNYVSWLPRALDSNSALLYKCMLLEKFILVMQG